MKDNKACCAHSKVLLKHYDYPDGTRSDYWECDSGCGTRFWPDNTDMERIKLRAWFAGMALRAIVDSWDKPIPDEELSNGVRLPTAPLVAQVCCEFADALISELNKTP